VTPLTIAGRPIGAGHPCFVIAEMSANHGGDLDRAVAIVAMAAAAGADAVKVQTYTADTMTLDAEGDQFVVGDGTPWTGRRLHDLYAEAAMPWEWYPTLAQAAADCGVVLFSSPFDATAVDFLVAQGVPALKIASFELTDLPLIAHAAATGLPLIMSTGMATADEVDQAVNTALDHGASGLALLRCTSAYPAPVDHMDLRTIVDMANRWDVPVGLSDHTLDDTSATVAVALGASIVEKHVTMSRADRGPDASFSLEPNELAALVARIRATESSLGTVRYGPSEADVDSLAFRRSLYVVTPISAGEIFTTENVRSLRPAGGLEPANLPTVLGRTAACQLEVGEPLSWDHVS
jgi:N-acetylneuraminate synthase